MTTSHLADRYATLRAAIADQCAQLKRPLPTLIAVTKSQPLAAVIELAQLGQCDFGENYLQEALEKITAFNAQRVQNAAPIQWHYIGALQSNKTAPIAQHFDWVHTLSRADHAQRLARQRPANLGPLQVCIQINISHQDTKAGIAAAELWPLAAAIARLPSLQLRGLMCIPSALEAGTDNQVQAQLQQMQDLSHQLQQHYPAASVLSMGMSEDWPLALRYGATHLRLGSALLGPRVAVGA